MKVSKCPSDALTMTNRAVVSPSDFDPKVSEKTTFIFFVVSKLSINHDPCLLMPIRSPRPQKMFTSAQDPKLLVKDPDPQIKIKNFGS